MNRVAFAVRTWNNEHRQGRIEIGMDFTMLFRSIMMWITVPCYWRMGVLISNLVLGLRSRKDAEDLAMVSKKARASGSVSDHVPEDVPHLKALVTVEAIRQPCREP
ncbi:hypothetical protein V6N13_054064 [Hibiscus sabdariffa]